MVSTPSPSTPFPYTTLFRSQIGGIEQEEGEGSPFTNLSASGSSLFEIGNELSSLTARRPYYEHLKVDRKSTRLNSSHVAISYAVFCLTSKTELEVWRRTASF